MKRFILITSLATLTCLFVAGQALSAGNHNTGMGTYGSGQDSGMMSEGQQQGMMYQNLNTEQIREAQTLLNERGHKAGAVDGVIGENTRTAIRAFQKSEKLSITGKLDDPTLRALAPTTEKHEFFGLSPAYGEAESKTMEKLPETVKEKSAKE